MVDDDDFLISSVCEEIVDHLEIPGLSMGMGFPWESSHGMGWDSTHLYLPWESSHVIAT